MVLTWPFLKNRGVVKEDLTRGISAIFWINFLQISLKNDEFNNYHDGFTILVF